MLRVNDLGFLENTIGMPLTHVHAFRHVAGQEQCVIMVRATGGTCHGPLSEGYDTKGYRIHGKSCDWGPMAGFVLRDPRLSKYGLTKEASNRRLHREALVLDAEGQGWNASVTPLKISQARKNWLQERGLINIQAKGGRWDGKAEHRTGISFYYSLIPDGNLLGVYFDNTRLAQQWRQEKGDAVVQYHPKWGNSYEPMLAMTNPPGHRLSNSENYLNAVTGDYDLFAIWPRAADYNAAPGGADHRPLGTVKGSVGAAERQNVEHLERHFTQGGQGTKLGNITNRIYLICQLINSIVGRHVLWHSDEAARPFLDDMDLPVLAVNPSGQFVGIETIMDFKTYITLCEQAGMRVTLSNAWTQAPTAEFRKRLGTDYQRYVPADGVRLIVPDWYNA